MERRPLRTWKNKRRKSVYTEQGDVGFIYKKLPDVEGEQEMPAPMPVEPAFLVTTATVEGGEKDGQGTEEASQCESLVEEDQQLMDVEIEKDVEIRRFVEDLRKELQVSAEEPLNDDACRALEVLSQELRESDLYFAFLECREQTCNHLAEEIRSSIESLGAMIGGCEREMEEWEELMKKKTTEAEETKQDYHKERELDFLHLTSEDEQKLMTYLSSEQQDLLHQDLGLHSGFMEDAEAQLQRINTSTDSELRRAHQYCQRVSKQLDEEPLDLTVVEDTPRTLFRAMKNHV